MAAAPVAFEAVDREFRPKVLRYLATWVGRDEAADLTQVTLWKVSRHLPEFRGDSSIATWVYRIATNVARDHLRQSAPSAVPVDFHSEAGFEDELPATLQVPSAEQTAARAEMGSCIRQFVDALPAHYRSVLILGDVEGLSDAEVAQVLGLSTANAKMRLHRARASLRARLREGCSLHRDERNEFACDRIVSPASSV